MSESGYFTTGQASRLTGLSPRQLHELDHAGAVRPSILAAGGRGSRRIYDANDLACLKVAAMLRSITSSTVVRQIAELLQRHRDGLNGYVVVNGDGAHLASTEALEEDLRAGPALVVPTEGIRP